ncbi:unnamed protein product [Triticum turgidum subsp. durum]|uniref:DNA repair metallo-beta-lactamase domain-containing protein n=1 Tax=Triticum turgidum subsp. durum TaxID=4567 RepID=A0A9R0ZGW2_TRITD|nr:unnamed protein product [Triticum turgidum subsp. durum]
MRDEFGVWHVCLTMHSSREELEQALRFLQPKWVISTTPPCLAMDLAYVKKHCFLSRLSPEDPIWKLLRIPHGNPTVTGSPRAAITTVEAIKQSEEQESEDTWSAVCSQVLQDEEPVLQDFAIEVAQPVTLFGRARFGLPQDCELWKDEYESVQVAEEAKLEEELQNSNAKSFELWKDFKSDKGTAHMIDLTQAVTNELHGSAIEPELQDCESIDGIQVIDITHGEVREHSSSRDGCAELAKDVKCNEGAEQIRESVKFTAETVQAKVEATEELLSEDRTVLSDISNRSEGPDTDRADTAGVGSSKVLNAKLRRLYRSMNVAVPRPLPSLVELMGASKRPRVSSQFFHL